jgi:UDP-N-acetylglucosamine 1-carboxyvinyltransferase
MCAEGRSVIRNVYQIERGYENLVDRLSSLGARIQGMEGSGPAVQITDFF